MAKVEVDDTTKRSMQRMWNIMMIGMAEQRRPAYDEAENSCRYRIFDEGQPTLRCNIGFLIPDDKYDSRLEDMSAEVVYCEVLREDYPGDEEWLKRYMAQAQHIHDTCFEDEDMVSFLGHYSRGMKSLAIDFGLDYDL